MWPVGGTFDAVMCRDIEVIIRNYKANRGGKKTLEKSILDNLIKKGTCDSLGKRGSITAFFLLGLCQSHGGYMEENNHYSLWQTMSIIRPISYKYINSGKCGRN